MVDIFYIPGNHVVTSSSKIFSTLRPSLPETAIPLDPPLCFPALKSDCPWNLVWLQEIGHCHLSNKIGISNHCMLKCIYTDPLF